jgi:hypothetical protein
VCARWKVWPQIGPGHSFPVTGVGQSVAPDSGGWTGMSVAVHGCCPKIYSCKEGSRVRGRMWEKLWKAEE